jgi:iron(III) transport system substrate-binding protein
MAVFLALALLRPMPAGGQEQSREKEWNDLVLAAKKEGKVVVAGPAEPKTRQRIPAAFQARFGVAVEYLSGRTSELVNRLKVERRAGLYSVDVFLATTNPMYLILYPDKMLDPLRPALVLPEVSEGSKWKKGKLWFMDPEEKYILRLFNNVSDWFHLNTIHVKPAEIRTAKDLLHSRWREKISVDDPTGTGGGGLVQAGGLYVLFGEDFVKKFYVDQKPIISRDRRQMTDWLARGTYPISMGADNEDVDRLRKEGLPLLSVPSLPDLPAAVSSGGGGLMAIANRAPHPSAARLFVNWMASKEGLEIYSRSHEVATTRTDIDESYLRPERVSRAGVEYFDNSDFEFVTTTREKARLLLKELLRR